MIGIGGIGMSALARLFVHEKKQVSGSDRSASKITNDLETLGITFFDTQVRENITSDIELIVYTEAMSKEQEEMVAAKALGVPMLNYFEALGLVANQYYLIAVSGTHGKTTTTAMLTDTLEEAGLDPTAIIGSLRAKTGSNFRPGKSKYMIVEACEYRRDFLSLEPDILVITNIEAEHLDYYKDLADIQDAFKTFIGQVREGGAVVTNARHPSIAPILKDAACTVLDYAKYVDPLLKLKVPGMHNHMNAAAAKATAEYVGVKPLNIREALEGYVGTWRRFEYKGDVNGAKVYDDYGHHPTEITATLKGVCELYPDKKIFLVYQPHLDSRTEKLFDNFVTALSSVDRLVLNPAYAARAVGGSHDSTKRLAEAIKEKGAEVEYIESFDEIVRRVKELATADDVVLVMGAGDISKVAEKLV